MRRYLLCLLIAAALPLGCGQTRMLTSWKSDSLQRGAMKKVLVVGVFKLTGARESVEGFWVEQLKGEGVQAVASHAFLSDKELSRSALVDKVRELDMDGVLFTRSLDRTMLTEHYTAGTKGLEPPKDADEDWYKTYADALAEQDSIRYTSQSRADVQVETRLYDARTTKLVWSGVSETKIDGRDVRQIQGAVGHILEEMVRQGAF